MTRGCDSSIARSTSPGTVMSTARQAHRPPPVAGPGAPRRDHATIG